jgi:hypothetical protein
MSHEAILREMFTDLNAPGTLADGIKLRVEYINPPIPIRSMDWVAYDDNTYDGAPDAGKKIVGQGVTLGAAVKDFAEQWIEENCIDGFCASCEHSINEHVQGGCCTKCDCLKWQVEFLADEDDPDTPDNSRRPIA